MVVMGLNTCSSVVTCELLIDGKLTHHTRDGVRSFVLDAPNLAASILAQASMPSSAVSLFVVNVGPGSWTGIRVGVSFTKALALALGRPVVAVPAYYLAYDSLPQKREQTRVLMRLHGDSLLVVDMKARQSLPSVVGQASIVRESLLMVPSSTDSQHVWYGDGPVPERLASTDYILVEESHVPAGTLCRLGERLYAAGLSIGAEDLAPNYGLPFPAHRT